LIMAIALSRRPSPQRPVWRRSPPTVVLYVILFGLLCSLPAQSQTPWEITPYRCRVWLAVTPSPTLPSHYQTTVRDRVTQLLQARHGATWEIVVEAPPAVVHDSLHRTPPDRWENLAWSDYARDPILAGEDKLFLVRLTALPQHIEIVAAELDLASRQLGTPQFAQRMSHTRLDWCVADLVNRTFCPLAAVHRVEEQRAELRVRAGQLLTAAEEPASIRPGHFLQAIAVPYTPSGKVRPEGIRVIPWTVLEVTEALAGRLSAVIHSGYGQPLRPRRSRRLQQLASVQKIQLASTTVQVQSHRAPVRPLRDYELLEVTTGEGPGRHLGYTDRRGQITLEREESPLRKLQVRHGMKTLAEVPIVVGSRASMTLPLADDDDRLELEGFVQGTMDHLVDVVAHRQLTTARIRRNIERGKFDDARTLITQLRKLESRSEFMDRIQRRQRMLAGSDRSRQTRTIDKMFTDARSLLEQYLDPLLPQRLQDELTQRESAPPP